MSLQLRSRKISRNIQQRDVDERLGHTRSEINIANNDILTGTPPRQADRIPSVQSVVSKTSNTTSLRRQRLVRENFIQKLRLEQELLKKQQEILDHEFQLKLAEVDEEEENEKSKDDIQEDIGRPNIAQWINRQNPWDSRPQSSSESNDNFGHSKFSSQLEDETARSMPRFTSHQVRNPRKPYPSWTPDNLDVNSTVDFVKPVNQNNSSTNPVIDTNMINKFITRHSLPQELPAFDGNPLEWPNYIYHFRTSSSVCGFTDEENQCRLQKSLKGNARKIVQSLLITPGNLKEILELLRSRFGRPEQIISILLENLRKLPTIRQENHEAFINFSDEMKNFITTIQSLNEEEYLYSPLLLHELVNKLPFSYRISWTEYLTNLKRDQQPKFIKIIEFSKSLDRKANLMVQLQIPSVNSNNGRIRRETTLATTSSNLPRNTDRKCTCCENEVHKLNVCGKFKSMSVDERWSFVTSKKICFSCLIPFHALKDCRKRNKCSVKDCQKYHNAMLHKYPETKFVPENDINCNVNMNRNTLLKIIPVNIVIGANKVETYALLDDASTLTLIDQKFADELKLSGPEETLCLQWTNEQMLHTDKNSRIVSILISGNTNNSRSFRLKHVRTTDLSLPPQTVNMENLRRKYPYLSEKIQSLTNARPKIIIGQDNWPLLVNRKLIYGPWDGPVASKTLLGWVVHGNIQNKKPLYNVLCQINYNDDQRGKDDLDILHDLVKEQWKFDTIENPLKTELSIQDKQAQNILNSTMQRIGKKYETGLLWKNDKIQMPESKTNAMRRLYCVERKMDKNPVFAKNYCDKINDLMTKGYLKKLSEEEILKISPKTWYLPHFGVVNPNKPNKLRIVFDASSKSHGASLNDFLLTGPDLYNSLYTILLNFRIKKYAFTADIKEMFLQVKVREEDTSAQRILWRGMNRSKEPDIYAFTVVFFGSVSGPCLAQEAKNRNARDHQKDFPQAAEAIIYEHYMDDYLGNADTLAEAQQLVKEIIFVHGQGGFVICNWIANNTEILRDLPDDLKAETQKNLENRINNVSHIERILGVYWDPKEDIFKFDTKFYKIDPNVLEGKRRPTKREILKVVMSIFDPLGFLSTFTIQGKILLQDIWRSQIGWDDEITDLHNEKWQFWLTTLKDIYKFEVPRQYFSCNRDNCDLQLHIFCDASETAYAAVAYIRAEECGDSTEVNFITAKTRVTPLKPLSIPRLELQAALLASQMGNNLKRTLKLNISDISYWSDSKTVLHWIRSEARRFKSFVAQRIGEIQDLTNVANWHYVPSKENAADDATKKNPNGVESNSRWINGPAFLRLSQKQWPKEQDDKIVFIPEELKNLETKSEARSEEIVLITTKTTTILPLLDPRRFSKWTRLVRTTAYVLKFIDLLKKKIHLQNECISDDSLNTMHILSPEDIKLSEKLLFRKVQEESFAVEISFLRSEQSLNNGSRLKYLSCFYDKDDKLIKLSGRLNKSKILGQETKSPIILDPKHRITELLILYYHTQNNHFGQETVINNLRSKFWILRIRQSVKSIWYKCQQCKNRRTTVEIPTMGQLPVCRIEPTIRPFIKTGVDYFGPIEVSNSQSSSREKIWSNFYLYGYQSCTFRTCL